MVCLLLVMRLCSHKLDMIIEMRLLTSFLGVSYQTPHLQPNSACVSQCSYTTLPQATINTRRQSIRIGLIFKTAGFCFMLRSTTSPIWLRLLSRSKWETVCQVRKNMFNLHTQGYSGYRERKTSKIYIWEVFVTFSILPRSLETHSEALFRGCIYGAR